MLQVLAPLAAAAIGGYLFVTRGKAHIGETVVVLYKPGGQFGEQGIEVQGKVISKTNPIIGPYYSVQLFQLPKIQPITSLDNMNLVYNRETDEVIPATSPEQEMLDALARAVPSTISGLKDSDILANLSRK